jgi:hypothetical protein
MQQRKYLPTLGELIDRLSIVQLKEVFIAQHKDSYSEEIKDILHDIQAIIDNNDFELNSEVIGEINVTDAEVITPEINVEN